MPDSILESPTEAQGPAWEGLGGLRVGLVRYFLRTPTAVLAVVLLLVVGVMAAFAHQIAPADPFDTSGSPLSPPGWDHLMGTDDLGRDVLSGVIHGARTSMIVAISVIALASFIGITIGGVAGHRGGLIDDVLMRLTEFVQTLPRFFLAVLVVAMFGPGFTKIVAVLGLTSWTTLARVVRAETLSVKRREYVEAARSLGASDARILLSHIVPNISPSAVVAIALMGATVILTEASLGFIGLRDPNFISLGYMASNAQRFLRVAWWMVAFPGAAIVFAVVGLNLLADAVNDLLDPLSERRMPGRARLLRSRVRMQARTKR
jgi:peptide/nickel transport system permease protein